jgi:hypothetical protein
MHEQHIVRGKMLGGSSGLNFLMYISISCRNASH